MVRKVKAGGKGVVIYDVTKVELEREKKSRKMLKGEKRECGTDGRIEEKEEAIKFVFKK